MVVDISMNSRCNNKSQIYLNIMVLLFCGNFNFGNATIVLLVTMYIGRLTYGPMGDKKSGKSIATAINTFFIL